MGTIAPQGEAVIRAHLEHLLGHGETELYRQAVEYLHEQAIPVPDLHARGRRSEPVGRVPGARGATDRTGDGEPERSGHRVPGRAPAVADPAPLLNPAAGYFDDADLLVAADCAPFAYGDFHRSFLAGRILIIFCPKLDREIEEYIEQLAEIFTRHTIRLVTVLRMEVPCCGGVRYLVDRALERAGNRCPSRNGRSRSAGSSFRSAAVTRPAG